MSQVCLKVSFCCMLLWSFFEGSYLFLPNLILRLAILFFNRDFWIQTYVSVSLGSCCPSLACCWLFYYCWRSVVVEHRWWIRSWNMFCFISGAELQKKNKVHKAWLGFVMGDRVFSQGQPELEQKKEHDQVTIESLFI